MYEIEDEIEVLENALSNLSSAMENLLDSPYHKHLANSVEFDMQEIKDRLEELYEIQNAIWAEEMRHANYEYERSVS